MSTLFDPSTVRGRVPRFAEAAVERARLTVVPQRLGRTEAARTPFAVLVLGMLVAGVVGLLMFNTHMQQASFTATALQSRLADLTAQQQSLDMELDRLRDPQRLAVAAKRRGMVAPTQPAFIRLADGKVLGTPAPANAVDGAVRINPLPQAKPAAINPPPLLVRVPAPTGFPSPARTRQTGTAATGAASGASTQEGGRKKVRTPADPGATR